MIVLSRVAFWVYDMVDAQIFQTVSSLSGKLANLLKTPGLLIGAYSQLRAVLESSCMQAVFLPCNHSDDCHVHKVESSKH